MKPQELILNKECNIKSAGIYMIYCSVSGKAYIGQSRNMRKRWYQHREFLKANTHSNPHLQSAVNLYGLSALSFYVLENCSKELLTEREGFYLDQLDKSMVYNQMPVSDVFEMTEEMRKKKSESAKGKMSRKTLEAAWNANRGRVQ